MVQVGLRVHRRKKDDNDQAGQIPGGLCSSECWLDYCVCGLRVVYVRRSTSAAIREEPISILGPELDVPISHQCFEPRHDGNRHVLTRVTCNIEEDLTDHCRNSFLGVILPEQLPHEDFLGVILNIKNYPRGYTLH